MGRTKRNGASGEMVFGAIVLLFGTLLLLDNVDIIEMGTVWMSWPLVLVAIGINKMINSSSQKETGGGIWLIFLGFWLLISINRFFGLAFWDTWPMLIIAWGVSEIWKALSQKSRVTFAKENTNATE